MASGHSSLAAELRGRAPIREILDRALAGARLSDADAIALIECPDSDLDAMLSAAAELRDRGKGRDVTYSRKVFLPITNLCRDRCTYCTFRKDPGDPGAWTMMPDEIAQWSRRGAELGCKEALMCLGDKPEVAFKEYRETLATLGVRTTIEYVGRACEIALAEGLLPHTNAGLMTFDEMRALRPLNVSMGLMLENISPRLRARGGVHQAAPDKDPALRMKMIDEAGELRIPFTTGILLGIGETPAERAQSLTAIRDTHERHGHIQEVIIQNFRAKPEIAMADAPEPDAYDMARAIATARLVLGPVDERAGAAEPVAASDRIVPQCRNQRLGRDFAAQQGLRESRSAVAASRTARLSNARGRDSSLVKGSQFTTNTSMMNGSTRRSRLKCARYGIDLSEANHEPGVLAHLRRRNRSDSRRRFARQGVPRGAQRA